MSGKSLIVSFGRRNIQKSAGNKAFNLHKLIRQKRNVSKSFVCTWGTYKRYPANNISLPSIIFGEQLTPLDNIHAVVNVSGATNLADESIVTVDGHYGKIFVL